MALVKAPKRTRGDLIVMLLLVPVHAVIAGLLIRFMYHRLIVPTFPGLPRHIGVAAALGLGVFVGHITSDRAGDSPKDTRPIIEREAQWVTYEALTALLALVIGWFI